MERKDQIIEKKRKKAKKQKNFTLSRSNLVQWSKALTCNLIRRINTAVVLEGREVKYSPEGWHELVSTWRVGVETYRSPNTKGS